MEKQSKYNSDTAQSIAKKYLLHTVLTQLAGIVFIAGMAVLYFFNLEQFSAISIALSFAYIASWYLIYFVILNINMLRFQTLQNILNIDCNAEKYKQVLLLIKKSDKRGRATSMLALELAKCSYYIGDIDGMYIFLQQAKFKKQRFNQQFVLCNFWANYYYAKKDLDGIKKSKSDLNNLQNTIKLNEGNKLSIRSLAKIIDCKIDILNSDYTMATDNILEYVNTAKIPLQKAYWCLEYAKANIAIGDMQTAKQNLQTAISIANELDIANCAKALLNSLR